MTRIRMRSCTCCLVSMNCLLRRLLACNVAYAYLHIHPIIIFILIRMSDTINNNIHHHNIFEISSSS